MTVFLWFWVPTMSVWFSMYNVHTYVLIILSMCAKMLHCSFSLISLNDNVIFPPGRSVCPGLPLRVDNKVPTQIQPSCTLLLLSISHILPFQNQGWRERTVVSQLNWTSSITNMGSTQGDSQLEANICCNLAVHSPAWTLITSATSRPSQLPSSPGGCSTIPIQRKLLQSAHCCVRIRSMGPDKGYPDQLGGARLAENVLLLMGNDRLALSSLWSQGDRGERSDNRLRLNAAGQEGDFARVCLQSDGEIEILMIMIITLTTKVKIIDHEISDHILAPMRGLQCCDPHPANKWHRAKDKVFSWFFLWWHMYILNVAATLKKKT